MVKKICNFLSTIVLVVLLAAAAVILVPMLLGYKEMAVLSGSMEPTIPVGSLVYVKPVEVSELKTGDVCTYYLSDGETFVTHRVMSIDPDAQTLVTQGDANEDPDGDIQFSQVYGRADFHLPYLGFAIQNTYYQNLAKTHGKASDCIACRKCERSCPQHLPIVEDLKQVAALFEK